MSNYVAEKRPLCAYVMPNGVLRFERTTNTEWFLLRKNVTPEERIALKAMCEKAYDGKTPMVPGIQQADTIAAKLSAFIDFGNQVQRKLKETS